METSRAYVSKLSCTAILNLFGPVAIKANHRIQISP